MPLLLPMVFHCVKPSCSTSSTQVPFLCEQTDVLGCFCLAKQVSALSNVAAVHLFKQKQHTVSPGSFSGKHVILMKDYKLLSEAMSTFAYTLP